MSLLLLFDDATVTITATPGNAVADGVLASITRTIPTTAGDAVANGVTAGITQVITAAPGNAISDGVTVGINQVVSFSPGNAVADGLQATITVTGGSDVVITAFVGNAIAEGINASIITITDQSVYGPGSGWPYLPTGKKTKGKRFDDQLAKAMQDIYEGIEEPEILRQAAKVVRPMVKKGIQKIAIPIAETIDWERLEKDAEKVSALLKLWQEQLQFREEEEIAVLMSLL
jgi:hypothetical protein